MRPFTSLLFAALSVPALCIAAPDQNIPDYVAPAQQAVLKAWLSEHPEFRVANDKDCECSDDIEEMRKGDGGVWKPNPNFHPYYVSGDFNRDKQLDFAVILIKQSEKGKHFLAFFNGPFVKHSKPAFFQQRTALCFMVHPDPNLIA
ncbi:MAG TPA: hypothetical protein VFP33_12430 [Gallionella sp.]|nr:hypothetical protein [Gallionella sp.]